MEIWFTSDTHFNHENILSYCTPTRPWNTVTEMNEALIEVWNANISDDDTVYHLGDFILGKPDFYSMADVLHKLKGNIKLIPGNHDTPNKLGVYKEFGNIEVVDNIHVLKKPRHIVMCHYPLEVWHHNHKGSWHLHGHSHGYLKSSNLRMDVGVDTHPAHRPYHYDEVKETMTKRSFALPLHHAGR